MRWLLLLLLGLLRRLLLSLLSLRLLPRLFSLRLTLLLLCCVLSCMLLLHQRLLLGRYLHLMLLDHTLHHSRIHRPLRLRPYHQYLPIPLLPLLPLIVRNLFCCCSCRGLLLLRPLLLN